MKKFFATLVLTALCSQAFATGSFLAGLHDKQIALGGLLTTTTTTASYGFMAGLIVFADNGDAYVNLGNKDAQEALKLAVQKSLDGEELTSEDIALLEIYATQTDNNIALLIEKVAEDL